jgi:hypothetical protein
VLLSNIDLGEKSTGLRLLLRAAGGGILRGLKLPSSVGT